MKKNRFNLLMVISYALIFIASALAFILFISKVEDTNVRISLTSIVVCIASYLFLDEAICHLKKENKKAE